MTAGCTPLVTARMGFWLTPSQVALAVTAWSLLTALAPLVRRSEKAVMSNWPGVPIDALAQVDGEVHLLRIEKRRGESPDQAGVEALVARRDRRVDGEHRIAPDVVVRVDQRLAFGQQLARALDEQERGVTFIEVPDGRVDAQRAQSAHATHAQHDLLVQAHLAAAHVQDVRDRPVGVVVVRDVRVEQQQRHPADLRQPDRAPDRPAGQLHANVQRPTVGVAHAQYRQP